MIDEELVVAEEETETTGIENQTNNSFDVGLSPFGMSRKFRRALFSSVRQGKANDQEVEKFKSLGREAYPWMTNKEEIRKIVRDSLKK